MSIEAPRFSTIAAFMANRVTDQVRIVWRNHTCT
jgi:hypothetical protein